MTKGKTVRSRGKQLSGVVVRLGDPNSPLESGIIWVRFANHGIFAQRPEDLEAVE